MFDFAIELNHMLDFQIYQVGFPGSFAVIPWSL